MARKLKDRPRTRQRPRQVLPLDAGPAPVVPENAPAGLQARLGLAFGILATVALPLAYQWTFRPSSRPPGAEGFLQAMQLAGILAATAALLLGRRARASGDRSTGAIWAPRMGGAAIVGYAMALVVLIARSG